MADPTDEKAGSSFTSPFFLASTMFGGVTEATVWALIQDSPLWIRAATLPPAALAYLFFAASVGESDKKRQRTFKIIATSCAILYAVVIAIALINWFGVPFSFWSQFGKGFALIFLTVFILACPFVAIVEHRSGKISALLCLTIVGFECVMVTGFAIGFLDIRSIQADLRHYVMPRHLDPDKIEAISDYLQKFPPHSLIICWDGYDSEASSYADQIRTAVFNGGWTVKPCPDPTSDLRKVMGVR